MFIMNFVFVAQECYQITQLLSSGQADEGQDNEDG